MISQGLAGKNQADSHGNSREREFPSLSAWYSPENGNTWPNCLPHHFGGCFARFLESVLRFGRLKSHFLALENGHFCTFAHLKVSCSWKPGISVKDLSLPTKYKNQRDDLFGEKGQSDSVKVDNLHLRGRKGKLIYQKAWWGLPTPWREEGRGQKLAPSQKFSFQDSSLLRCDWLGKLAVSEIRARFI